MALDGYSAEILMAVDLLRFCEPGSKRGLDMPFRSGGYVYATDGVIAVRVLDDVGLGCGTGPVYMDGILRLFGELDLYCGSSRVEADLDVPEASACMDCGGLGEFEYGSCVYECGACCGTGEEALQRVKLMGFDFNRYYLKLVGGLEGVKVLGVVGVQGSKRGLVFRFSGGIGFLLAMKEGSDGVVLERSLESGMDVGLRIGTQARATSVQVSRKDLFWVGVVGEVLRQMDADLGGEETRSLVVEVVELMLPDMGDVVERTLH